MDLDDVLLDEFVAEANEHLLTIEDDFLALERQKEAPDSELVDKLFRAIHSVKGGAAFVGLSRIKELSHAMENLLSKFRSRELAISSDHIDALLKGVDLLNTMIAAPMQSDSVDFAALHTRLKALVSGENAPQPAVQAPQPVQPSVPEPQQKPESTTPVAAAAPLPRSAPPDMPKSSPTKEPAVQQVIEALAEPPDNSPFTLDEQLVAQVLDKHERLYHLTFPLAQAPEAILKTLQGVGKIVTAHIMHGQHDIETSAPSPGFLEIAVLLATDAPPEALHNALAPTLELNATDLLLLREKITAVTSEGAAAPEGPEVQEEPEVPEEPETPAAPLEETPEQPSEAMPESASAEDIAPPIIVSTSVPSVAPSQTHAAAEKVVKEPAQDLVEGKPAKERSSTIRLNVGILDKLMTLAGELVLVRNQQLQSMESKDSLSRDVVQRLDMVTTELQETIMQTRMQPVGNVFNKLPRIVRDLSASLGKEIELSISGNEVELDKTLLESLNDPLIHIVRNCCDHGIESPEVREQAGKSPTGEIRIQAFHEGGQINIEIADDGHGISPLAVRRKALERGLRSDVELNQMSDREVISLVMLPGFSTAEQVSDISGRGVGMDVVRHAIESLGGSVELESWEGEGTTLHLRLPLPLAIIPCLIVVVGDHRFAIPQVNLEELVCLYDDDVHTKIEVAGNQEVYRLRNKLLPMVRLSEILARPRHFSRETKAEIADHYHLISTNESAPQPPPAADSKGRTVLPEAQRIPPASDNLSFAVVKVGAERFGLIVDKVLGTEEIVVKPMHPSLKSLRCYSGATVMGDGTVSLILDIEGIARHAGVFLEQPEEEVFSKRGASISDEDTQSILLFRNGPNEQFALALPLTRRIEKISMQQVERVGNKEFITVDGQSTLVLRLDKLLHVSPCMERDEMFLILPKFIKRPFGILMSEILDIEETSIKLNTDSYVEEGLLGTDIIRDHLTLFPDIYRLIELAEPQWFAERRLAHPLPEGTKRILIVEDSSFMRNMLKRYLEADGHQVWETEDGKQALDVLENQEFDLVVSDIEMPVMDGLEFVKNLRHSSPRKDVPTLALTSLNTEEDKRKALTAGFDRYQVKIDRERFLADVTTLLTDGAPERRQA